MTTAQPHVPASESMLQHEEHLIETVHKFVGRSASKKAQHTSLPLAFEDVHFTYTRRRAYIFPERVPVLHGVSGYVHPGEMLLISGPSASGKSTLLNVIAQRTAKHGATGTVLMGGHAPTTQFVRRFVSYMEQYDSLFPYMSVTNMLMYQAALVMPRTASFAQRTKRVQQLITLLFLANVADRRCASLSKGELRRVSLGMALLSRPKVLLMDEPFTDNDAYVQDSLLLVLRELCRIERLTVVAVINRPTSTAFDTFDRLVMLVDGRSVYCGAAGRPALEFLQNSVEQARKPGDSNPEYGAKLMHWAMVQGIAARLAEQSAQDTEQGQQAHALIERMAVEVPSLSPRETDDDVGTDDVTTTAATEVSVSEAAALEPAAVDPELGIANGREGALQPKHSTMESAKSADKRAWRSESRGTKYTATPWWHALCVLWMYRGIRNVTSLRWLLPRSLDKLIFAIVLALIFQGAGSNIQATMLITVPILNVLIITIPMFSAVSVITTIFQERRMFYRERKDGLYSTATYLLYRLTEEASFIILYSLIISLIVFYVVELQGSFIVFWLTYMLINFTGTALAYLVASLCRNQATATIWVPSAAWAMFFFAGGLIAIAVIPEWLTWLPYMDPLRYAFVALQDNHWSEVQQPIVDGSIPAKLGEVVNGVINNLLNKIPFLAPSSPNPAPSGIGGIVSNLVGGLTGSAGDVVKNLAGGVSSSLVQEVTSLGVDTLMGKIKELINSAITLRGLAAETLNAFLTDTSSVTYYDVARAIFDFNAPYTAWANYGLLWVFCAGFTVLTYIAMVLFEFTSPSTVL